MQEKQKIAKAKRDAKKQSRAVTLELGASAPPEIQQSKKSESRQARQRRKKRESAEAEENALTAGSACIPEEKLAGEIPDGVSFKEFTTIFLHFHSQKFQMMICHVHWTVRRLHISSMQHLH